MSTLVRCEECLQRLDTARASNPVNREESAALQTLLVFPLQLDPNNCYKWKFYHLPEEYHWIDGVRFEVLHNPMRCSKTDIVLFPSPGHFIHTNRFYNYSYVHFVPCFPTKTCDCLIVIIADGQKLQNKEAFREKIFFNTHFSA